MQNWGIKNCPDLTVSPYLVTKVSQIFARFIKFKSNGSKINRIHANTDKLCCYKSLLYTETGECTYFVFGRPWVVGTQRFSFSSLNSVFFHQLNDNFLASAKKKLGGQLGGESVN